MNTKDVQRAIRIIKYREKIIELMRELNNIVGSPDDCYSIPTDVLMYVDRQDAAKGLQSLIIQSLAKCDADLKALGVNVE